MTRCSRHFFGWLKLTSAAFAITFIVACGGGGSDVSEGVSAPPLTGQVVKGLTRGATVNLFELSSEGDKRPVASKQTDSNGSFTIPNNLKEGIVYLFEAQGGEYNDEIDGMRTILSAPLRTVFIAGNNERHFTLSAISESFTKSIENEVSANKWSTASVSAALQQFRDSFSLRSPHGIKFIDIQKATTDQINNASEEELQFSFQVGFSAGFVHEFLKRRPGSNLTLALEDYYSFLSTDSFDDRLNSIQTAGLVRFIDTLSLISSTQRSSIYNQIGLPSEVDANLFSSAESTGSAVSAIPNWTLRYLSPPGISTMPTTDTVFNDRGALIAFRKGEVGNGVDFSFVGSSSVAEVSGDIDFSIGRWNYGYSYEDGVRIDRSTGDINTSNRIGAPLRGGTVYAAGTPATDLPVCGKIELLLEEQTRPATSFDGLSRLRLMNPSRIVVQFVNGAPLVSYDFSFSDENGTLYSMSSIGDIDTPVQRVDSTMEFGSISAISNLPERLSFGFRAMLVGAGSSKAVIRLEQNSRTASSTGLAAVFKASGALQNCFTPTFSRGFVGSLISDPTAYYNLRDAGGGGWSGLSFSSNGSPLIGGVNPDAIFEKSGNAIAGIGLMALPYSIRSIPGYLPAVYTYHTGDINFDDWPGSGSVNYELIASTPFLVTDPNVLISADRLITSGNLRIYFGQSPLGSPNPDFGICQLTVNGEVLSAAPESFRPGGLCSANFGSVSFDGGISAGDHQFAVIRYRRDFSPFKGEAALLFRRLP